MLRAGPSGSCSAIVTAFLKMIDRLVVGGSSERAFAGLYPIGECELGLVGLDVVLGDELGLGEDEIGIGVDEDFRDRLMIVPAPSAEERLIRRVLDERMAEDSASRTTPPTTTSWVDMS